MNTEYGRGVGHQERARAEPRRPRMDGALRLQTSMPELPRGRGRSARTAEICGWQELITAVRVTIRAPCRVTRLGPHQSGRAAAWTHRSPVRAARQVPVTDARHGSAVVVHLGMSGQMLIRPVPNEGHRGSRRCLTTARRCEPSARTLAAGCYRTWSSSSFRRSCVGRPHHPRPPGSGFNRDGVVRGSCQALRSSGSCLIGPLCRASVHLSDEGTVAGPGQRHPCRPSSLAPSSSASCWTSLRR